MEQQQQWYSFKNIVWLINPGIQLMKNLWICWTRVIIKTIVKILKTELLAAYRAVDALMEAALRLYLRTNGGG
jgi:hypothetical protein